jgi:hypothetical protein
MLLSDVDTDDVGDDELLIFLTLCFGRNCDCNVNGNSGDGEI